MTGTKKCANFGGKWVSPPLRKWLSRTMVVVDRLYEENNSIRSPKERTLCILVTYIV